jgi:hypothetical protein
MYATGFSSGSAMTADAFAGSRSERGPARATRGVAARRGPAAETPARRRAPRSDCADSRSPNYQVTKKICFIVVRHLIDQLARWVSRSRGELPKSQTFKKAVTKLDRHSRFTSAWPPLYGQTVRGNPIRRSKFGNSAHLQVSHTTHPAHFAPRLRQDLDLGCLAFLTCPYPQRHFERVPQ